MADQLLIDLHGNGRITVELQPEGDSPRPLGPPRDLTWPVADDGLEELRWYLEDYLVAPFGVYEDRGDRVAELICVWGRAVFESVFGGERMRDAYQRVRGAGRPLELVFRSAEPALLALPWELMTEPGEARCPLAPQLAAVNRSLPTASGSAETVPTPQGRLRVLMVISRPRAAQDIAYGMIARPLLDRLGAVRGEIDLVVLRPPTVAALRRTLAQANAEGRPFQIVHFDGHGVGEGAPPGLADTGAEGILVFESPSGGADRVPASRLARILAEQRVPVVVLNACQSGAVGKNLEAAVATSLLLAGIASVVAMAYKVYAVAAAEFMADFYESLFAGNTISAAVTAGRQRLHTHNARPSPKGRIPLADWLVPVHYRRRDISFPQAPARRGQAWAPSGAIAGKRGRAGGAAADGALESAGAFVGRDSLLYELEQEARRGKIVVLHGTGGTGKTELAKAFGRWWRDTGGVDDPAWVFWHSCEPGTAPFSLEGILAEIGPRMLGADFERLPQDQRYNAVRELLAERRALLIWDNFETVRSMPHPAGAESPHDDDGGAEVNAFLASLAVHDGSRVLITSRTAEDWLEDVHRITVGRLAKHEAIEYADTVLGAHQETEAHRATRSFGELMEWLDGHPLSMRLILPNLRTADAGTLLTSLRDAAQASHLCDTDNGRTQSLAASIRYSYAHLSPLSRRLLPALSLLHGVADAYLLAIFSRLTDTPPRFRDASDQDWREALADAARVGLLNGVAGIYGMPPALPAYLAAEWRREEPDGHDAIRDAAVRSLLTASLTLFRWIEREIKSGDAATAFIAIKTQYRTFCGLLEYALDHGLWREAGQITDPMHEYWKARSLTSEAEYWTSKVRAVTAGAHGELPDFDTPAGRLWITFVDGRRTARRDSHDNAESIHRRILADLRAQLSSPQRQGRIVATLGRLGEFAEDQERFDEAADLYREALDISEGLEDDHLIASGYYHLGELALRHGRLDEAEEWFHKNLPIANELDFKPGFAGTLYSLGTIAENRGRPDEAEQWLRQSFSICHDLNNKSLMAKIFHGLGKVAELRWSLGEAQDGWRRQEAEEWYRKSLALNEETGDMVGMAMMFGQLGRLSIAQGDLRGAFEWTIKCLVSFNEISHPWAERALRQLASITYALSEEYGEEYGVEFASEVWREVTGDPFPREVSELISEWRREEAGQTP